MLKYICMTMGERIKKYRSDNGLSQEELAEKLNVSRQAITKWENDNGVPDMENVIALSKLMGTSLDELVLGEKKEPESVVKNITEKSTYEIEQTRPMYLYKIRIICFAIAIACFVIAFIIGTSNGNDYAVINIVNALILMVPLLISLNRYLGYKNS